LTAIETMATQAEGFFNLHADNFRADNLHADNLYAEPVEAHK
jgi:hypothetical protein